MTAPGGGRPQSKGGRLAPGKTGDPAPQGPPWARGEKPRNFRRAISQLFGHVGRYRYWIYAGVVMVTLGSIISIIAPKFLEQITDTIAEGIETGHLDMQEIGFLALLVVALYAISMVLSIIEHYVVPAASQHIANMLRRELSQKINRLPLNYYDNSTTGDIMSRLTNDADTIGDSCGISLSMLFTAAATLVGCVVMMFWTCPLLAAVSILPPVFGFIATRLIVSRTHRFYVRQSRDLGAMNGLVEETYYGHDIIRAYSGEDETRKRFVEINEDLYQSTYRSRFISSTLPQIMGLIGNLNYVIVCTLGSMLVIQGEISYGVIVAFIVYIRMFSHPLLMLTDALASMQSMAASSERVFDLLNAPEMEDESHKGLHVGDVKGDIEFRDVSFSYLEGIEIIHNFSLDVRAGQKVAIVGPTGAGKTTIVNLLMRFYEVDRGDILIDGISTKDLRRDQVHSMFTMVLQDSWLFDGSIRDNLVFNKEGVTAADIETACRSVGIHDFIIGLPDGYDTVVNDSAGISAGQRQQLAIARAIIHAAPMVIFDEATSSVDTRTDQTLQAAMDELPSGRTSFIIAHRLTTIVNCDRIMVMKGGRIVETGTHQELLDRNGFYAELYNSQFENCD